MRPGVTRECPWRCGAGVLLSSGWWKEIVGGGLRSAWTQGYSQVSGWPVWRRLHLLGCWFCTNRPQLCHDATNGCPTSAEQSGSLERAAAPGTNAVPCAPPPPAAAPSCSAATQLRAWRHVGEARRGAVTSSSGVLDSQLYCYSFILGLVTEPIGRARGLC